MTRIAILFSGFSRSYNLATLEKFIMAPNRKNGADIDIYVSTWDTVGNITEKDTQNIAFTGVEYWSRKPRSYDNTPVDKERFKAALEQLSSRNLTIQYPSYEEKAIEWLAQSDNRYDFVRGKDQHTLLRAKGMWFGMMDVYSMVPNPTAYDFLVRCRLDIAFGEPILMEASRRFFRSVKTVTVGDRFYTLAPGAEPENPHIARVKNQLGISPKRTSAMLVPCRPSNNYVDDWFAVGTPKSMRVHMSVYSHIDSLFQIMHSWPEPFENESITVWNAYAGGVDLILFPKTSIFRAPD